MCGLVGGTNPHWNYARAVQAIGHRGPDSQAIKTVDTVTLGFARLAVIDVRDVANQPMASPGGEHWIVFNGEVYGHQMLRKKLEFYGAKFRTESDTEVLLAAYRHWGDSFVDHIDGMFAIAIYDKSERKIKLYRDRPGIKPLYYFWNGAEFAFASELKALVEVLGNSTLDIDSTAAYDFLTYGYVPTPKSLYRNVYKLPPASWLTLDLSTPRLHGPVAYWGLVVSPERQRNISTEEAAQTIRELVDRSVMEQMIADVPIGCFLSGGIDSSILVASAAKQCERVLTFSIGFEDDHHSETQFARELAGKLSTHHHERTLARTAVDGSLERMRDWYDEPFADSSAFPTFLVCQVARETVTVALSGDGGDELFGGYTRYRQFQRLQRLCKRGPETWATFFARRKQLLLRRTFSRKLMTLGHVLTSSPVALYTMLMGGLTREEKRSYARRFEIPDDYDDYWYFRQHWRPELPILTRLQYLDFHTYLPDDILTKVDRVSMANSLEVRVPLLSRRLIEFAFSLPELVRFHNGRPKGLLRNAYRGILPDAVLDRKKRGFSIPLGYHPSQVETLPESILHTAFADLSVDASRHCPIVKQLAARKTAV
ncbi:Asparagine synthetase [glutamine-hydrolyzing] 1 [Rosistilla carotiformis]|uniref:asparagine synthase (glutamine-hydrolyzing) n=1 Tax=Rosistilla carotiformis TaxID=2528017 RepID=A0A518K0V4_9BACT|nr:asparagine synthase (glutamine-hydrolyzing) [Rosistilla carotiformis]QDV71423.1 Asparagine synthetase [glutamine-hydrolyzing] 1 [Rosistilla carotiformis]